MVVTGTTWTSVRDRVGVVPVATSSTSAAPSRRLRLQDAWQRLRSGGRHSKNQPMSKNDNSSIMGNIHKYVSFYGGSALTNMFMFSSGYKGIAYSQTKLLLSSFVLNVFDSSKANLVTFLLLAVNFHCKDKEAHHFGVVQECGTQGSSNNMQQLRVGPHVERPLQQPL